MTPTPVKFEPASSAQEKPTPDELLELRIGAASSEDIIARAEAYAMLAGGHPVEAAKKARAADVALEEAQSTALNAYFEEVKKA